MTRTTAATTARLERALSNPRTPAPGAAGLGTRLRIARLERGVTAARLAELSGLSQRTIEALEAGGGWRGETVEKLAQALGVDPGELAGWPLREKTNSQETAMSDTAYLPNRSPAGIAMADLAQLGPDGWTTDHPTEAQQRLILSPEQVRDLQPTEELARQVARKRWKCSR